MSSKKNGRPLSETARRYQSKISVMEKSHKKEIQELESRIKQLEDLVFNLENNAKEAILRENLDSSGFGLDYNPEKRTYNIRVIKYDSNSPDVAKIVDTVYAGDTSHRAMFELRKLITREIDLIHKKQ